MAWRAASPIIALLNRVSTTASFSTRLESNADSVDPETASISLPKPNLAPSFTSGGINLNPVVRREPRELKNPSAPCTSRDGLLINASTKFLVSVSMKDSMS
ncbi:hypothetical protein BGZ60DRAFT_408194 [Tricladium varicosporioides]|nr:hypothetical protein BGZ60DRAFT_408194 [Hymenoscyphus varicosporioides]